MSENLITFSCLLVLRRIGLEYLWGDRKGRLLGVPQSPNTSHSNKQTNKKANKCPEDKLCFLSLLHLSLVCKAFLCGSLMQVRKAPYKVLITPHISVLRKDESVSPLHRVRYMQAQGGPVAHLGSQQCGRKGFKFSSDTQSLVQGTVRLQVLS